MQNDVSAFTLATLLLFFLSIITLVWFWSNNRSTPGLFKLVLSCVFGGVGLSFALAASVIPTKLSLSVEYAFLFAGHLMSWLGIAAFWQRQTRMLTILAIAVTFAAYLFLLLHILNGAGVAERTALAAGYYMLVAFGVLAILPRIKATGYEIYHATVSQSRVGVGVIKSLFLIHGIFNLYHLINWERLNVSVFFGFQWPSIPLDLVIIEAMIFAPMLILGTVIMVAERLQTELRIEQMLDPVTKGLNRRAFITVSKAILARARRNADAVTLLMVEVINFKNIRDNLGREATDAEIARLGQCIFEDRREQDIFCRFSNDEFMLMLPGTPEDGAKMVQARIVDACNSGCASKGAIVQPDVSIAFVTSRGDDLEIDGMIENVIKHTKPKVIAS